MSYIGSWKINDYLTWSLTTHVATTGAVSDADANPSFRIYEDNVGTPLTNGSMVLLDDTNTVGFYHKRLQLTTASGFEVGKTYNILNKGTVNSVSGQINHTFQIESGQVVVGTNNDKTGYNITSMSASVDITADSVDKILDEVVEGTITMRQMLRIFLSKLAGEANGGGTTTINFRDNADSKNRISMTVDVNGNRSAVSLDGS